MPMLNKKTKCSEDTVKFVEHDNKFKGNSIEVRKGTTKINDSQNNFNLILQKLAILKKLR